MDRVLDVSTPSLPISPTLATDLKTKSLSSTSDDTDATTESTSSLWDAYVEERHDGDLLSLSSSSLAGPEGTFDLGLTLTGGKGMLDLLGSLEEEDNALGDRIQ